MLNETVADDSTVNLLVSRRQVCSCPVCGLLNQIFANLVLLCLFVSVCWHLLVFAGVCWRLLAFAPYAPYAPGLCWSESYIIPISDAFAGKPIAMAYNGGSS